MIIGITGPAGSGKSTAGMFIAGYISGRYINLDHIGHEYLTEGATRDKVIQVFGKGILSDSSSDEIDRKKLGNIVFSDPKELKKLNDIMFPKFQEFVKTDLLSQYQKQKDTHVIIDGAILEEAGITPLCDIVIAIVADRETLNVFSPGKAHIRAVQRDKAAYKSTADASITNTFDTRFEGRCISTISQLLRNKEEDET